MADSQHQHSIYDASLTDERVQASSRPADVVHGSRHHDVGSRNDPAVCLVKEFLRADDDPAAAPGTAPTAFAIRDVLTPSECDELLAAAEGRGAEAGEKHAARTSKRTEDRADGALSEEVGARIQRILESRFRDPVVLHRVVSNEHENGNDSNGFGDNPFSGIQTNWRVLRYDADDGAAFPAHRDQIDGFQKPENDGSEHEDLVVSSHTLLLQLSEDPRAKAFRPKRPQTDESSFGKRRLDYAVDVVLPRGWALLFRRRGAPRAGTPPSASSPRSERAARTGVLRVFPEGVRRRPPVFEDGPGATARAA